MLIRSNEQTISGGSQGIGSRGPKSIGSPKSPNLATHLKTQIGTKINGGNSLEIKHQKVRVQHSVGQQNVPGRHISVCKFVPLQIPALMQISVDFDSELGLRSVNNHFRALPTWTNTCKMSRTNTLGLSSSSLRYYFLTKINLNNYSGSIFLFISPEFLPEKIPPNSRQQAIPSRTLAERRKRSWKLGEIVDFAHCDSSAHSLLTAMIRTMFGCFSRAIRAASSNSPMLFWGMG